jgi:hypothetical protein
MHTFNITSVDGDAVQLAISSIAFNSGSCKSNAGQVRINAGSFAVNAG